MKFPSFYYLCSRACLVAVPLLFATSLNGSAQAQAAKTEKTAKAFEVLPDITYAKPGGTAVKLDAYLPTTPGLKPGLLLIHGGAWKAGSRKGFRDYATELATRGFACFSISYRLAPDHKFPAQIDDCRAAVVWLRANAQKFNVDPDRLGAIGFSAGGHLATLLATSGEAPSPENGNVDTRIQAAAAGGAPTEFRLMPDNGRWAKYWMGGDLSSVPEKFKAASPTVFVDAGDPPVLFFNGTADKTVPLLWTMPCYFALKEAGVETEMYKVKGAGHSKTRGDKGAKKAAFDFLERILIPKDAEKDADEDKAEAEKPESAESTIKATQ